ncbi:MAG TPA: NAD(P)H-dependent oxidoreductase [Noviherbaspirillum sp.]|nr:NAD(P)H-dependent oxidoreductase [Noviherbaspirillum sp.]
MTTLLQINASMFSNDGQSSRLSGQFVSAWREAHPQGKVVVRDLAAAPVPHLDAQRFGAFLSRPEERSAQQQAVLDFSDGLIEELRNADVIALGLPMYNFGVPSALKAYFDHVARAGVTFRYTENGPVGLLKGKKAYIFATRGGVYAGSALDTQTGYVRDFLRFIGIDDVDFVYAEGLNMGEESKQRSLDSAAASIRTLAEPLRAAA